LNLDAYASLVSGVLPLTIATWVQVQYDADATWPNGGTNYLSDMYSATGRWSLYYTDLGDYWVFKYGGTTIMTSSVQTFSAGDWIHLAVAIDTSDAQLYINGVLDDSYVSALIAQTITDWTVGSIYFGGFGGGFILGEHSVFGRALTGQEVAAIVVMGRPLTDFGAIHRPGIYLLDGEFRLASSTSGIRTELTAPGIGVYDDSGTTGVGRVLFGLVDTSSGLLDEASSDLGLFGYDAADTLQVAWYASGSSAGKITAGGGNVVLDENGITLSAGVADVNLLKWEHPASVSADVRSWFGSNIVNISMGCSNGVAGGKATVTLAATGASYYSWMTLYSDGYLAIDGGAATDIRASGGIYVGGVATDPGAGNVELTGVVKIDGVQVVNNRVTGWTAATGTATRTMFATSTVTTEVLAQHLKALIDDMISHGLIGT
jgi:hypothetical protein